MRRDIRVVAAGDSGLVIELSAPVDRVDPAINARTVAIAAALEAAKVSGVRDVLPTYHTVSVFFDPLRTDRADLDASIRQACLSHAAAVESAGTALEIPVCYGGEFGPDLGAVAAFAALSETEVIRLHSSTLYRVFMLGFFPGFAYMGSVDSRIAAPRRATPRVRVPRGSVGIAGQQTGIYPSETPGGWQLIGRTPLKVIDPGRPSPFLFRAGDSVRFVPIDPGTFTRHRDLR